MLAISRSESMPSIYFIEIEIELELSVQNLDNSMLCSQFGGIWDFFNRRCLFSAEHIDIISVDIASLSVVEWQSGEITVTLADGTPITTPVTSAVFDFQSESTPEPSSLLGLLTFGTLGAASTLKRKLKN